MKPRLTFDGNTQLRRQRVGGEKLWGRFNAPRDRILWHYNCRVGAEDQDGWSTVSRTD